MKELLRTADIVRLSFLESVLAEAGIDSIVLDRNTGSVFLGAIEPRLMVADDDLSRARWVVEHANGDTEPAPDEGRSDDRLLDGRVILRQPTQGFRAAIDPVLLAASVPAGPGEHVLELGCGTGAAALCLARRAPGVRVVGLELQPELASLATANAAANGLEAAVSCLAGDLLRPPAELGAGSFDHVMANPPYLAAGTATLPADAARAAAVGEGEARLADWVGFALSRVRLKGSVTFIHRADRLEALLAALHGRAGDIAILPLWPGAAKPAKRVVVRARRGVGNPSRLLPGLVLHEPGGAFTEAAEAILRDGAALEL